MSKKEYYIVSFKHIGSEDNSFEFWKESGGGYTRAIENAGLYELEEDFESQKQRFKVFIHKSVIDKLKQKIRLPIYGDREDTYSGLNEFYVLPNTGQVRRELCITTEDFNLKGNRDSFTAFFKDTCIENYSYKISENEYEVKMKEDAICEWWHYVLYLKFEDTPKNKMRNKALYKAYKDWDFDYDDEYDFISFQKLVTCRKLRIKYLKNWTKV